MKAFRGVTPGLSACKAPVQQRPTAPNIVKMAEGGTGRRLATAYIQLEHIYSAHAPSMAASPTRMRVFLKDGYGRQESQWGKQLAPILGVYFNLSASDFFVASLTILPHHWVTLTKDTRDLEILGPIFIHK